MLKGGLTCGVPFEALEPASRDNQARDSVVCRLFSLRTPMQGLRERKVSMRRLRAPQAASGRLHCRIVETVERRRRRRSKARGDKLGQQRRPSHGDARRSTNTHNA